jgi:hypothetical protein
VHPAFAGLSRHAKPGHALSYVALSDAEQWLRDEVVLVEARS